MAILLSTIAKVEGNSLHSSQLLVSVYLAIGEEQIRSFPATIELLKWPFFMLPPPSLSPYAVLSSSLSHFLHFVLPFCDC